jgi:uncharacterized protein
MKSRLYEGRIWHTRRDPAYTFEYRAWYVALDLAEVDEVASRLRLFSHNRFNVTAIWDSDYLALEEGNFQAPLSGSVELLTMPRFLGHVFNPVSFFLSRDERGSLIDVPAEVHNTWNERHLYRLMRETGDGLYTASAPKAFYVSPFIDLEGAYHFELREEHEGRLRLRIDEYDGENWFFGAGMDVRPMELSDTNLAQMLLQYPFLNLKTVAMIHWQGLRIWRRGGRFRPNPGRGKELRRTATGDR